jgi:hypothetical protein
MASKAVTAPQNSDGSIAISIEGKATYHYFGVAVGLPANCTDLILIRGSATKTVKIKLFRIAASWSSAASTIAAVLVRRSADNTGGTRAAVTAVPHDINDPAATAAVYTYSVLASPLGTQVGILEFVRTLISNYTAGTTDQPKVGFEFCRNLDKPIILRGISDFICLNFYGTGNGQIDFDLTLEEDDS